MKARKIDRDGGTAKEKRERGRRYKRRGKRPLTRKRR